MSARYEVMTRMVVEGRPVLVGVIQNPTIDDVVVTEARIHAASVDRVDPSLVEGRRVDRRLRDYLVRLGVER